jgi:hypothetical protein
MTKMANPMVMRAPPMSAQILGRGAVSPAVQPAQQMSPTVMPQQVISMPAQETISPSVPQTGLIGSEQALLGGQSAGLGAMSAGNALATASLNNIANLNIPSSQIGSAPQIAGSVLGSAPQVQSATINAPLGISQQYTQNAASAGFDPSKANAAIQQGVDPLTGYSDQGQSANKLQADLSGANGGEAQAAAMASVQGNPYAEQMKQNAERTILQNASVTGSLGGGNVLDQLYKNSAATFAEDYQNRFDNLGAVSDRGANAAGQIGQLRGQQAGILGNLEAGRMSSDAQLQAQRMGNEASIYGQQLGLQADLAGRQFQGDLSTNLQNAQIQSQNQLTQFGADAQRNAQNAELQAQNQAMQFQADQARNAQNTQLKADAYSQLANLAQANGLNTAGLLTGTAQQIASGRTQAGQAIAQNAQQAASSISNMLAQNGIAVSDMMAKDISTVTDMIYQSGMQDKIDSQQLATILANISGGQASTLAQGYSNIGAANAAGTLGMGNAAQNAIGQIVANTGASTKATPSAPTQGGIIGSGTGSQYGAYV